MGAIAALYIGLFVWCLQKYTDITGIKGRLISLSVIGIMHLIVGIIGFFLGNEKESWLIFPIYFLLIYGWCIIKDFRYYRKATNKTNSIKKKVKTQKSKNMASALSVQSSTEKTVSYEQYLDSVGKIFFIKYYEQLKLWHEIDILDFIEKNQNEELQKQRINAGKKIFELNKNIQSLRLIVSNPLCVDDKTHEKAKILLQNELNLGKAYINQSDKNSPKYIKTIHAKTHSEFINKVFKSNLKGLYKSICWYSKNNDFAIWMIRLYPKEQENWENTLITDNNDVYISEKYIGCEINPTWNGKQITLDNIIGKRRLIVEIEDRLGMREYRILGVFDLCDSSTDLNRLYKKIPDKYAKELIPEAYI